MAGVAVRRRGALLGVGAARVARAVRVARALAGALLLGRRRIPAAPACAAAPFRGATIVPRLVARARATLAALATVAPMGSRLDPLVAASRIRPQLCALPELGRRLLSDASVSLSPKITATECARPDTYQCRRSCTASYPASPAACATASRLGLTAASS